MKHIQSKDPQWIYKIARLCMTINHAYQRKNHFPAAVAVIHLGLHETHLEAPEGRLVVLWPVLQALDLKYIINALIFIFILCKAIVESRIFGKLILLNYNCNILNIIGVVYLTSAHMELV